MRLVFAKRHARCQSTMHAPCQLKNCAISSHIFGTCIDTRQFSCIQPRQVGARAQNESKVARPWKYFDLDAMRTTAIYRQ